MKSGIRVLAIDDSSFSFSDDQVTLVGVLVRSPNYMEAVIVDHCTVDGDDATDAVVRMVEGTRYREQVRMVLIDGAALGGFNIVDIDQVVERTGVPCVTVTRALPDMASVEVALLNRFSDARRRLSLITSHEITPVDTGHNPLQVSVAGMAVEDAARMIRAMVVCGALPEPLRMAHLIATALVSGESRGRA